MNELPNTFMLSACPNRVMAPVSRLLYDRAIAMTGMRARSIAIMLAPLTLTYALAVMAMLVMVAYAVYQVGFANVVWPALGNLWAQMADLALYGGIPAAFVVWPFLNRRR